MLVMNPIHLQTLLTIVDEGSFEDAASSSESPHQP